MKKFKNKYRIPSNRLQGYDYGSHGLYYVTICTKNRKCYFGDIVVETHNCASDESKSNTVVETHNCASNESKSNAVVETHNRTSDESKSNTVVETHNRTSDESKSNTVETHNRASDESKSNTVETHNRASLRPTIIGQIAIDYWIEIPKHYPFVELDEFVVMPNHIHGILFFNNPGKTDWNTNTFGPQSQNLGAIIRAYKSSVKRFANQNGIEFDWQPRYHDHIIRDERSLLAIRNYIINNPDNWYRDILNNAVVDNDAIDIETQNTLKNPRPD